MDKTKKSYHNTYRVYLESAPDLLGHKKARKKIRLATYQKIGILFLIVVASGFIGWMWEFLLAWVHSGFTHFYMKGGNLLPWMNIYAYGAIIVIPLTYKLRRYPWVVFIVSALATGLLEWFAGWVVFEVGHGTRYWDYSHDVWGIGNINGFVCPASAIAFGLGSLALMYWLFPRCIHLALTMKKRAFLALSISLFTVVMVDDLTNLTLKNLDLPTAQDFYRQLGWEYK